MAIGRIMSFRTEAPLFGNNGKKNGNKNNCLLETKEL